ncbi:MAG: hypothetical protein ACXQS5_01575 [Candidatus Methanospirareceae archaeon]
MNKNQTVDAKLSQFDRNKYFYGKLMTVRDFEAEQSYFNEKRRLLSRLIHGTGVVCGLELSDPVVTGRKLTLKLSPGVAIDCCGRAIVVGEEFSGKELEATGTVDEGTYYVHLKYEECDKESVPVPANASACEEACCYNRVEEIFEVVVSQEPPGEVPEVPIEEISEEWQEPEKEKFARDYFDQHLAVCPTCTDPMVLLAVLNVAANGDVSVDESAALVYNNPMLYELMSSHLLDLNNPHEVDALKSIEGLSNPGGNIDLSGTNDITINTETPANADPRIIIGESHSVKKNNPHAVTAGQVGALKSVDGVANSGGDVDLVAGANITITPGTPNPTSITITSTGGANPATTVTSVDTSKVVGASGKYAREDHMHDLADGVVEFGKLAAALQDQLNTVYQYLRERALKCTVGSFKEVGEKFGSEAAVELSRVSKEYVDKRVYEGEDEFMDGMKTMLTLEYAVAKEIEESATDESFEYFHLAVEYLEKVFDSKDPLLKAATAQDEVCFYASLLENAVRQYKDALECTVTSFAEVGERFGSDAAIELSKYSRELVDARAYEDEDTFMEGMGGILKLGYNVAEEIEKLATEDSFENFRGAVEYLEKVFESGESLAVAKAQSEVCRYALLLNGRAR